MLLASRVKKWQEKGVSGLVAQQDTNGKNVWWPRGHLIIKLDYLFHLIGTQSAAFLRYFLSYFEVFEHFLQSLPCIFESSLSMYFMLYF